MEGYKPQKSYKPIGKAVPGYKYLANKYVKNNRRSAFQRFRGFQERKVTKPGFRV